jgi:hypothetical protein
VNLFIEDIDGRGESSAMKEQQKVADLFRDELGLAKGSSPKPPIEEPPMTTQSLGEQGSLAKSFLEEVKTSDKQSKGKKDVLDGIPEGEQEAIKQLARKMSAQVDREISKGLANKGTEVTLGAAVDPIPPDSSIRAARVRIYDIKQERMEGSPSDPKTANRAIEKTLIAAMADSCRRPTGSPSNPVDLRIVLQNGKAVRSQMTAEVIQPAI